MTVTCLFLGKQVGFPRKSSWFYQREPKKKRGGWVFVIMQVQQLFATEITHLQYHHF